jgi:cytochrome o ubiquinol oxidase subunit I
MFGRLSLEAIHYDPIVLGAQISILLGALTIIVLLTYFKRWKWLWTEWICSLDHKKIGVMYIIFAFLMLLRGGMDAVMMRAQQVLAASNPGYLPAEHFQQIFTAHGVIMIFFVAMPLMFGLINVILPLQIGARDVAFPYLNSLSFWLFIAGMMLMNAPLFLGEFAATGWLAYPPLSGIQYSPGVGVDYYIWALQISGIGSLLSGVNFLVTILKMRAPGMSFMKMPVFVWSVLGSMLLIIAAFPILTATLAMLSLDRMLDMRFFTSDFGGNPMMYINLIWAWGHPEVYILILPAFGIYSEVVATFSQKRLFGYTSMVWAIMAITILSFIVWLHHFFTMGGGANVNAFFGIMTMIIAVPTGVKVFNWLFTMFRGRITFKQPMLWFMGFVTTFAIGGMTGVLMAVPAIDFQMHNSLFLVAHFHNMVIGGVLFGYLAGLTYWFPKIFGFKLNELLGRYAFWLWITGFVAAFGPLYILGLMGATRRLNTHDSATGWQPLFIVAAIGVLVIMLGVVFQVLQLAVSIWQRKQNRDLTGDPWDGRTLEWSTPSPAPLYNFAHVPQVTERDAFWAMKHGKTKHAKPHHYEDIHMPKNTPMGVYVAAAAFVMGFGLIWHMWWLALLGVVGIFVLSVIRSWEEPKHYFISAEAVAKTEAALRSSHR